jgi:hypothetical protein
VLGIDAGPGSSEPTADKTAQQAINGQHCIERPARHNRRIG